MNRAEPPRTRVDLPVSGLISSSSVIDARGAWAASTGQESPINFATLRLVIEVGSRGRSQPPPPHIVFNALSQPDRDPSRRWLHLLDDEQSPRVITSHEPSQVEWSSLWRKRPDAIVRFDLAPDGGGGTDLRWTLLVQEPIPSDALVGHLRKRLNQLINADLRNSFGQ